MITRILMAALLFWVSPALANDPNPYVGKIGQITAYPKTGAMVINKPGLQATSGGCPSNTGNPFYMPNTDPAATSELLNTPQQNEAIATLAYMALSEGLEVKIYYTIPFLNRCVIDRIELNAPN